MTMVYYFSPDCSEQLLTNAPQMTQEECEMVYMTDEKFDVYKYSRIADFEESFNEGFISDEGVIRFF